MFLEATQENSLNEALPFDLKFREETKNIYAIIKSDDAALFKILEKIMGPLSLSEGLVSFKIGLKNFSIMGFIQLKEKNEEQARHFFHKIDEAIQLWKKETKNRQVAHLAIRTVPTSFDPRIGGDENTRVLLKMLFEGLTRIGLDGKPTNALAESITLLPDNVTYIFHLRPSFWSDGSPLVAYDFEYAWKKILAPKCYTPFASVFYPIKNARLVKEGALPIEEVGIHTIDDLTLKVVLEYPVAYFLELIAHPLFSPISNKTDCIHPDWSFQQGEAYVCNGPFCLRKKNINYSYGFVKNPNYWDVKAVSLDQIIIRKVQDASVYEMFENGTIDWIGKLFPYWDPAYAKRFSKKMTSLPSPKVSWCTFNTQQFPLSNQKIRKALSYCIDKKKLISLLNYKDATPAHSPLPLCHSMQPLHDHVQLTPEAIKQLFHEGLIETGLQQNDFPLLTLFVPTFIIHEKTAHILKQSWKEILGITCTLAFYEWSELFSKMCQGDYQIALITWTSVLNDPIYTLNAFKHNHEEINFSKWENPQYQYLLNLANAQIESLKRETLLNEAEKILIHEMPVNPLFFEKNQCISQEHFHVPCDTIYGYPDFKWAFFDKINKTVEPLISAYLKC